MSRYYDRYAWNDMYCHYVDDYLYLTFYIKITVVNWAVVTKKKPTITKYNK